MKKPTRARHFQRGGREGSQPTKYATKAPLLLLLALVVAGVVIAATVPRSTSHDAVESQQTSTTVRSTPLRESLPAPPAAQPSPTTSIPTSRLTVTPHRTHEVTSSVIAVPGGSFRVIRNKVTLTHIVVPGDTLSGIAAWYKLMGGYTALYAWNRSTVGSNPNLIFQGEVLSITVPQKVIPKISPVFLAETVQGDQR
jgi:nucleoid-associated protein YgaU